ncbi:glutamine amidotransferase [Thioclava sp. SK-1]|uniref:type 1 glutamine amidotransferase n=1 Tax=Thioclava sp. SK-1 TaxID=1889770 RepID=UPI000824E770|nr:type 1 glutamine amidotransferase [Thioclava sp. SK-1]OCX62783.1 glutamine amidotransferase [Thioclava sp. SK-1]
MLIGILKAGPMADALRPAYGQYHDMFQTLLAGNDFTYRVYDLDEAMDFPNSSTDCDGWLITGSKHGAYEDHAFIPPLETFIRQIIAADRPLVGVCFGHQIIAQAMGGHVEKWSGGWAVGAQDYIIDGAQVTLNAWHQDQVTRLPDGFKAIGHNAFCANAAMVMGDKVFTIQPHPEFNDAFIADMVEKRGPGIVPQPVLEAAKLGLSRPKGSQTLADRIARTFKQTPTAGEPTL